MIETAAEIIDTAASFLQVCVICGGAVLAFLKKDKISAAFDALLSFSLRSSLTDLYHLLQIFSENSIEDTEQKKIARVALAKISGKIKGNSILSKQFGNTVKKEIKNFLLDLDADEELTDVRKAELCSELQERLDTLQVLNHNK